MPKVSVKIMLSYDYCHFEFCLSSDQEMTLRQADDLRKDTQRLADEAVRQYRVSKDCAQKKLSLGISKKEMEFEVEQYKNISDSEWPEKIKAIKKALEDKEYWDKYNYDYEDSCPF